MISKNQKGYYTKQDILSMNTEQILKLFIRETSYQDTLNVVRIVTNEELKAVASVHKKT